MNTAATPSPSPLRVEHLALHALRGLRPLLPTLTRADRDLSRQLRRAAASVVLNLAEGAGLSAGHRRERFGTALGSARECVAALRVAEALGYLSHERVEPAADRFDHVAASVYRLLHPRR